MTFKDLRKWLNNIQNDSSTSNSNNNYQSQHQLLFDKLKGLPFWIENEEEHKKQDAIVGDLCCFNHCIGLPRKDDVPLHIFDYETDLVKNLEEYRGVWVKKSRGLGVTEIILRYISWLCSRNDDYKGKRIHIVTGPRINLAEDLIDRIHNLFADSKTNPVELHQAGPIINLNNCIIQAFPSYTISSSRGYTDVKLIFIDEASFFIPSMQEEVAAVCEGYRAKTNPKIIVVSTPWKPIGFFYDIDNNPNSVFKKLYLDYTVGLNKIYNVEDVEKERSKLFPKRVYACLFNWDR